MGPRPFSRGNFPPQPSADPRFVASMGPRPFSRGNPLATGHWPLFTTRFNGATAFQPWKPGRAAVPEPGARLASMGPRPLSRGNLFLRRTVGGLFSGFNGATAFQPWKRPDQTSTPGPESWLQWGHGLSAVETGLDFGHVLLERLRASMGPRPFSRGNAARVVAPSSPRDALQWGHGLSAVET